MEKPHGWSEVQMWMSTYSAYSPQILGYLQASERDSVMVNSIPASLTSNDLSVQGGHVLTATDISLGGESFPPSNDLLLARWLQLIYKLQQAISPIASRVPNAVSGPIRLDISTAGGLRLTSSVERCDPVKHQHQRWNVGWLNTICCIIVGVLGDTITTNQTRNSRPAHIIHPAMQSITESTLTNPISRSSLGFSLVYPLLTWTLFWTLMSQSQVPI